MSLRFVTPLREAVATGHVKRVECDLYARSQAVEITVLCPDPYLYAPEPVQMEGGAIANPGLPVGIVAEGSGTTAISDGTRSFALTGVSSSVVFVLDTREGSKSVKNKTTGDSLMSKVASGSGWPTAGRGETTITGASSAYIVPRWLGL